MATSGSTDYSLNARQVITFALRKLGVVDALANPTENDMELGKENLNLALKALQTDIPNLWRESEGSVSLVAATASYSLTAAYTVSSARYRSAGGIDLPMHRLTRDEYYDLPNKSASGIPHSYYFDRQRAGGMLYVWTVPAAVTTETIRYTYQRRFEDIDALTDDIDIPAERLALVGYWLAVYMIPEFADAISERRVTEVKNMAALLMSQAKADDREPLVRFEPMVRYR